MLLFSQEADDFLARETNLMVINKFLTGKPPKEGSADFLVKIMFRNNVNWQGEIHWLSTDKKRRFRSSLELLMLIQEAMDEGGTPQSDYTFRSWLNENSDQIADPEELCLSALNSLK